MSLFISILFHNVVIICYFGSEFATLYTYGSVLNLTQSFSLSAIRGSCRQKMQVAAALGQLSDHDSTDKYILKRKAYDSEDLTIERSETCYACSGFCRFCAQ